MGRRAVSMLRSLAPLLGLAACTTAPALNLQGTIEAAVSSTLVARPTETPDIAATVDRAVASTIVAALSRPPFLYPTATVSTDPCGMDPGYYPEIYTQYEVDQPAELLAIPLPEITEEAIAFRDDAAGSMILDLVLAPCGVMEWMVSRGYSPYGLGEKAERRC